MLALVARAGSGEAVCLEPFPAKEWVRISAVVAADAIRVYLKDSLVGVARGSLTWQKSQPLILGGSTGGFKGVIDEVSVAILRAQEPYLLPRELEFVLPGQPMPKERLPQVGAPRTEQDPTEKGRTKLEETRPETAPTVPPPPPPVAGPGRIGTAPREPVPTRLLICFDREGRLEQASHRRPVSFHIWEAEGELTAITVELNGLAEEASGRRRR